MTNKDVYDMEFIPLPSKTIENFGQTGCGKIKVFGKSMVEFYAILQQFQEV